MRVSFVIVWRTVHHRYGDPRISRARKKRTTFEALASGISVSDREFLLAHGIRPPSEPISGGEEPVGECW
jgi:hypothetical protein